MKHTSRQLLAITLAGAMTLLAACGGGNAGQTQSAGTTAAGTAAETTKAADTTAAADTAAAETTKAAAAAGEETPDASSGMPLTDEPVTLTVMTTRWANMGDSFTSNEFLQKLEAESNVHIEWEIHSLNDWGDQKGIYLAGGVMPDIIFGFNTFDDADIMNNLELFMPLDDLIENYMPNYKKAMEEMPDLKKVVTFPDGHIYSMSKNMPLRPVACNQPIINKKWLDNLGLAVPTTIDELYEVLKAFKEQDANGNGDPNDEIPISGSKGLSMELLNPFGISDMSGIKAIPNDDGTITFFPTCEAYKEGIKWLNKLYAEGIIDPETFTQTDDMLSGKRQDPNVSRVGFEYAWTPDSNFGQWSSEYIAIAPIAGSDGVAYAGGDPNGVSSIKRNEVLISADCKNPEVAAKWIDQFYTGEASIQNFWGGIPTVITKHDDGTYTLNDPPEGTSADSWYWDSSLRDFGPKYVSKEFEQKIKLSTESGDGLKAELSHLIDGAELILPYPDVMFTVEENEERPELETDINKYIETTRAHWITEGGIDEEWDAYIEQLNVMGLERLLEIYTDAYVRFQGE